MGVRWCVLGDATGDFGNGIAAFFQAGFEFIGSALEKGDFFFCVGIYPARSALVHNRQVQTDGAKGVQVEGKGQVEIFGIDLRFALFLLVEDLKVCCGLLLSNKAGALEVKRFACGGGQVGGLEGVEELQGFLNPGAKSVQGGI